MDWSREDWQTTRLSPRLSVPIVLTSAASP